MCGDFTGGPVVKSLSFNVEDTGSIPGRGAKIPHAAERLSLQATSRESTHCQEGSHMMHWKLHVPQLRPDAAN